MTHIVWDWNGTLFDDIDAVVMATNEIFDGYGMAPLDVAALRSSYTRPIWVLYERLLGRPLLDGEWERLDTAFHDSYHRLMAECALAAGAFDTLTGLAAEGHRQSLLSMWRHERLGPETVRHGIDHFFARIDGLRGGSGGAGGSKKTSLVRHLEALGSDAAEVIVVGDSVDDAAAARHVGARAVLYTGGMTPRAELESVGVPVLDRLADVTRCL
jgi:phosphoglycolate phosphatase-like HAD superfamily hydrolase